MISLTCPNCSAPLEMEKNIDMAMCSYCGTKVIVSEQHNAVKSKAEQLLALAKKFYAQGDYVKYDDCLQHALEEDISIKVQVDELKRNLCINKLKKHSDTVNNGFGGNVCTKSCEEKQKYKDDKIVLQKLSNEIEDCLNRNAYSEAEEYLVATFREIPSVCNEIYDLRNKVVEKCKNEIKLIESSIDSLEITKRRYDNLTIFFSMCLLFLLAGGALYFGSLFYEGGVISLMMLFVLTPIVLFFFIKGRYVRRKKMVDRIGNLKVEVLKLGDAKLSLLNL
mgnify:CR=1 FL=1